MKKRKIFRRLNVLLAALLIVNTIPITALAEGEEGIIETAALDEVALIEEKKGDFADVAKASEKEEAAGVAEEVLGDAAAALEADQESEEEHGFGYIPEEIDEEILVRIPAVSWQEVLRRRVETNEEDSELRSSFLLAEAGNLSIVSCGKMSEKSQSQPQNSPLSASDYEIVPGTFINNVKPGTAKVTIRGKGNYGGMAVISFKIGNSII